MGLLLFYLAQQGSQGEQVPTLHIFIRCLGSSRAPSCLQGSAHAVSAALVQVGLSWVLKEKHGFPGRGIRLLSVSGVSHQGQAAVSMVVPPDLPGCQEQLTRCERTSSLSVFPISGTYYSGFGAV